MIKKYAIKLEEDEAYCSHCKMVKKKSEFYRMTSNITVGDSPQFWCKVCSKEASRKYKSKTNKNFIIINNYIFDDIKPISPYDIYDKLNFKY